MIINALTAEEEKHSLFGCLVGLGFISALWGVESFAYRRGMTCTNLLRHGAYIEDLPREWGTGVRETYRGKVSDN